MKRSGTTRLRGEPDGWLRKPLHIFGLWTLFWLIAAAPSWFAASEAFGDQIDKKAILIGILLFVVFYSMTDWATQKMPIRRGKLIRSVVVVFVVTGITLTLLFPFGFLTNLASFAWAGESFLGKVFSGFRQIDDTSLNNLSPFLRTLLITLFQGSVLSLVWLLISITLVSAFWALIHVSLFIADHF